MKQLLFSTLLFVSMVSLLLVSCSGKKPVRQDVFDPKAVLQQASKFIEMDEYDEARKLLFEVKNRDLSKKYAPLAQLKIAESFVIEGQPERAVEEYRRFLQLYPDHPRAPYAQYQIALVYFKQIESPAKGAGGARKALEEFQKLLRLYPRNPYREAVELKIRKCRNLIAEYEFLVGEFYYKKGSYNAATGRFLGLLKEFPDYKRIPEVLYLTGISYRKLNRTDESLRYLKELQKRFPDSEFSKKAEKVIAEIKP
ncbi:MAG: outer membrane protein assembly factor BamD [Nitrospirae bacterium]|nr:outer membrane protein assembly factor BamD [Nitrospirota bacterium]